MSQEIDNTLSPVERSQLAMLEDDIRQGAQSMVKALEEIRDRRLYRETHQSFDVYCRERWNMSRKLADAKIADARLLDSLSSLPTPPQNAAQARALDAVEPERRAEVMEKAASSGKVTAAKIGELASEDDDGNFGQSEQTVEQYVDGLANGPEWTLAISALRQCRSAFSAITKEKGGEHMAANFKGVEVAFKNLRSYIDGCRPHAVCPYCRGSGKSDDGRDCPACKGLKWLTKSQYDNVPEVIK